MTVLFHKRDQSDTDAVVLSVREAAALGYYVSLKTSRLTLRCFYSSLLSFSAKVTYEARAGIVYLFLLKVEDKSLESFCIYLHLAFKYTFL